MSRLSRAAVVVVVVSAVALTGPGSSPPGDSAAYAGTVPSGFQEVTVFSGLTQPTAVRFAQDGRVFVAEKSGLIKVFDNLSDTTPTTFADLRTNVHDYWDRGLLGMALDPNFPASPYVYVLYAFDHELGSSSSPPRWGDQCPNPPGPTSDGCVISGRLSRLQASGNVMTGSEQVLVEDWCQQYPSHSIGSVEFGPDGALYASGGDGASFGFVDYGQDGSPVNPCGDPPGPPGTNLTPPTAEGGALRTQDLRTTADPTSLDGAIIRVDPATGAALADNPLAASSDPNARRVIAYGLRNPLRFAFRPGTSEIWLGDVGWNDWEEINRVLNPTDAVVENFGWPCYEGTPRQPGYDAANLSICENLYGQPSADTKPYFAYHHSNKVVAGESCPSGSSSVAGIAFEFAPTSSSYPAQYQGALFFADYSRDCIWAMKKGGNPIPSPGQLETFVAAAANPVNLEFGPDGNLYYVDFDGGTIRRIQPSAPCQFQAQYFSNMTLSGSPVHTACEAAIDYDWGMGSPAGPVPSDQFSARWTGQFSFPAGDTTFTATADDGIRLWVDGVLVINAWVDQPATTYTGTRTLTAGTHEVKVEYYENGWDAVARVSWPGSGANQPPVPVIETPASTLTWKVGDPISFSGTASDPEQGTLPASALSWQLVVQHCPSNCHTHPIQSWTGVASGSFAAPDHEYPSYLELELTATDAAGATATVTRRLDPQTVVLTFASSPSGLQLAVNGSSAATTFTRTVIVGSTNTLSATTPQTLNGTSYSFASWSDGGAQTHNIVAPATAATYTATYSATLAAPVNTALPTISGGPVRVGRTLTATTGTWTGTQPMAFSYQWLRCTTSTLSSCAPISGATSSAYVPSSSDRGQRLRATVTATNAAGAASATSDATSPVK
jgi:glucose/arabinose dehydrogenase